MEPIRGFMLLELIVYKYYTKQNKDGRSPLRYAFG